MNNNRIHKAFENIKADENLKNSTMEYLENVRQKKNSSLPRFAFRKTLVVSFATLILFFVVGGGYLTRMPVSYISMDINPSIEFSLNPFNRVVSAKAYNEDGENVLNGLSLNGKLYTDAIDTVVESDNMSSYLLPDSELTFTVASKNDSKEKFIMDGLKNCKGCGGYGGKSTTANIKLINEAHENGVSFGKYKAYLKLSQYDDSITIDDCKNMSMHDIHTKINEHDDTRNNVENKVQNNCENGNGHKHKNKNN